MTEKSSSVILGLKGRGHDSAASLVIGGRPVVAMAQERFDRIKHSRALPLDAVHACLKEASIGMDDVEAVAISYDFMKALFSFLPRWLITFGFKGRRTLYQYLIDRVAKWREVSNFVRKGLGYKGAIFYLDHHDCHAASAYFTSGFKNAAILSVDGKGECESTVLYEASGHTLSRLRAISYPHSLGTFYSKFTQYLGYSANRDEGQVMALAAFGNRSIPEVENIISTNPDELYRLDLDSLAYHLDRNLRFSPKFESKAKISPRKRTNEIEMHHKDLAYSVQRALEKTILFLCNQLQLLTNATNLCLTGGVCLNAIANGKIATESPFTNFHVFPAAADDGTALGAAMLCYSKLHQRRPPDFHFSPYLGTALSDSEIYNTKDDSRLSVSEVEDIVGVTAKLLAEGKIVGWYQGRAEFGPRALGNRSILAAPYPANMKHKINSRVKFREEYRPYGACFLIEDMDEYFEKWIPSPYMNTAFPVRPAVADRIPAVVHVDDTNRIQTVAKGDNPMLRNLLLEFKKRTGLGVLLNTSLNTKGYPIANTLSDAIKVLVETDLDFLVAGKALIRRRH